MNNLAVPSMAAGCPTVCGAFEMFQMNWGHCSQWELIHPTLGLEPQEERWPWITIRTSRKTHSLSPACSHLWFFVLLDELCKPRENLKWFISAPTFLQSKLRNSEVKAVSLLQRGARVPGRHKKSAQGSWLASKWEEQDNEWKETRS